MDIISISNGKYKLSNGSIYSANKLKKVDDIVIYKPNDNKNEIMHKQTEDPVQVFKSYHVLSLFVFFINYI